MKEKYRDVIIIFCSIVLLQFIFYQAAINDFKIFGFDLMKFFGGINSNIIFLIMIFFGIFICAKYKKMFMGSFLGRRRYYKFIFSVITMLFVLLLYWLLQFIF